MREATRRTAAKEPATNATKLIISVSRQINNRG